MSPKFRVAIVGGGIAGLVLAVALSKSPDIEVHIYEAAHQFSEIGAGIGMFPRVWKIMRALGLDRDLAAVSSVQGEINDETETSLLKLRKSDQDEGLYFYDVHGQGHTFLFHRADFQQAIMKNIPPSCATHFSKRLASLDEPSNKEDSILLHFTDRSTATCDVVFGADGIKSAVRAAVWQKKVDSAIALGDRERATRLAEQITPMWSGTVAYRGLIPIEMLKDKAPKIVLASHTCPMLYLGKNKHLVVFPISRGKLINVVAFFSRPDQEGTQYEGPTVTNVTQEELLSAFEDFEQPAQDLLRCIEKPSRWAVQSVRPLDSHISDSGRVALVGDAAHAMTPHQGSGAGQAIEDAYILSSLLQHPACTRKTLPEAIKIYDNIRRPFSQRIWRNSRKAGLIYDFNWPGLSDKEVMHQAEGGRWYADLDALRRLGNHVQELQEWTWRTTIDSDRARAIEMLEKCAEEQRLQGRSRM